MKGSLHTSERSTKRQRTGVPGISYFTSSSNRRDGTAQRFLSVFTRKPDGGRKPVRFCITTLGASEAWRRAVECRAEYEARRNAKAQRSNPTH